jgi:hypothetical protein
MLEKLQIKYLFAGKQITNNFPYWSFSKFGIEFELKIKEALGYEIRWNLIDFDWNFQESMKLERALVCT